RLDEVDVDGLDVHDADPPPARKLRPQLVGQKRVGRGARRAIVERAAELQVSGAEVVEGVVGPSRVHGAHRGEAVGTAGPSVPPGWRIRPTRPTSSSTPKGLVM